MIKTYLNRLRCTEKCPPRKSLSKIAWSCLGIFISLYLVSWLSKYGQTDILKNFFLVAPVGASAVLIYGVPQAEFSQPRNVIGGHIISAFIGISVYKYVQLDVLFLGAIAVSLATAIMQLTRTLHPPSGATAFITVIGGNEIHELGYAFIFNPIAIGAVILVGLALLVNNLSNNPKRHYPSYWW